MSSLSRLHLHREKCLGPQRWISFPSKKAQDSNTNIQKPGARTACVVQGTSHPSWVSAALPQRPTPLTVHPADADHFKHCEEEQAYAAAGVIIKQLEDIHSALWRRGWSRGLGGWPNTHLGAALPSPWEVTLTSKRSLSCLSLPSGPSVTPISDMTRTVGTVLDIHRLVCPAPLSLLHATEGSWLDTGYTLRKRVLSLLWAAWVAEGKAEAAPAFFKIRRAIWLRTRLPETQTGAFLTMSSEQLDPIIPKTNCVYLNPKIALTA